MRTGISAHDLSDAAAIITASLSAGRRAEARLVGGPDRRFVTDLHTVLVPWPLPHPQAGLRGATCGIALQCSPSKERIARTDLPSLSRNERRALSWEEGTAALGWVGSVWPGLFSSIRAMGGDVEPTDPDATATELINRALQRSRRHRRLPRPPTIFGGLPEGERLRIEPVSTPGGLPKIPRSTRGRRLPGRHRIPFASGGSGSTRATPVAGPEPSLAPNDCDDLAQSTRHSGIPYDEWDDRSQSYRADFTRVLEISGAARGEPQPEPDPALVAWFSQSHDREWSRRRLDGSEVDIDAYIDEICDRHGGAEREPRHYMNLEPSPRDVATALLLDASDSVSAGGGAALAAELACASALIAALADRREPHAVFTFSGDTRHRVEVTVLKDFTDAPSQAIRVSNLRPDGYTRLGAAMRHVSYRLTQATATHRVMLIIGDGIPYDDGYEGRYAQADVAKSVEEAVAAGITPFFIGVGEVRRDPLETMFGPSRSLRVRGTHDLPRALRLAHEALVER